MDKKIKCIDNSGYKITVGDEYEVLDESQDFYYLVNDNGKQVKYGKTLFEEVNPEPPELTEQQMINSISNSGHNVTYRNKQNELITIQNGFANSQESRISCGIGEIQGINDQIQRIFSSLPDGEDDYVNLAKALFKKSIEIRVLNQTNRAMFILSTSTDQDEDLLNVLDEMSDVVTEAVQNPNSQRHIKTWIFYRR